MTDILDDFFGRYEDLPKGDPQIDPEGRRIGFGAELILYGFLKSCGVLDILDSLDLDETEIQSFEALIFFCLINGYSEKYAQEWYWGSLVRILFPEADLEAEVIDDLLNTLSGSLVQDEFYKKWVPWLKSLGFGQTSVLEGDWLYPCFGEERMGWNLFQSQFHFPDFQFLYGFDPLNEMPLYCTMPGEIFEESWQNEEEGKSRDVWASRGQIEQAIKEGKAYGLDLSKADLMFAYEDFDLLNLFYEKDYQLPEGFVTGADNYNEISEGLFQERLDELEKEENLITIKEDQLYCLCFPIWLDEQKKHKAWFYFFLNQADREQTREKIREQARENGEELTEEDVEEELARQGYFVYLSQKKRTPGSLLSKDLKAQRASWHFLRVMRHELSLRKQAERLFNGYLFLIFVCASIERLLDIALKGKKITGFQAICRGNEQRATLYYDSIVPDGINMDLLKVQDLFFKHIILEALPLENWQLDLSDLLLSQEQGEALIKARVKTKKVKKSKKEPKS